MLTGAAYLKVRLVGYLVTLTPKSELEPNPLLVHSVDDHAPKTVLFPVRLKSQIEDTFEVLCCDCFKEQTFLTDVVGPESPQAPSAIIDIKRQACGDPFAAAKGK